jgi:hypothetical protein
MFLLVQYCRVYDTDAFAHIGAANDYTFVSRSRDQSRYSFRCVVLIMIGSEYCTLQSLLRGISLIRQ